ncbi:MAG: outer membrane homotrimeric porin [Desulfovibrio sp.]|nr:outer membrane homotrimeric porin [Desulfovibrio sp.]
MKKKACLLLLSAALLLGVSQNARAIDFKVKGEWIMNFDIGANGAFTGGSGLTGYNGSQGGNGSNRGDDQFNASQRLRLFLDAVASESLSGTVAIEIGDTKWGRSAQGGALGADGTIVEIKHAYLDWIMPQTDLKIRMGIQGFYLPSFTTGSQILADDLPGIMLNLPVNENVSLTAFWGRPLNDNSTGPKANQANYMDNMDMFGLLVPLSFDGVKVTPWAMAAAIGPNAWRNGNDAFGNHSPNTIGTTAWGPLHTMLPAWGVIGSDGRRIAAAKTHAYATAWWAGLTGDIQAFAPFRIAFDFNYGSVNYGASRLNRNGWLASLLFEYKLDWGIPGLYGWYASGDDSDLGNGSERLPGVSTFNNHNNFSNYGFNGHNYIGREGVIAGSMAGTWGVGARLKDVVLPWVEDLKHTLRLNLMGGTNDHRLLKKMHNADLYPTANGQLYDARGDNVYAGAGWIYGAPGVEAMYLTDRDTALEVGLTSTWTVYENLSLILDTAYMALWLDKGRNVWGGSRMNGKDDTTRDSWNVNLTFYYTF